MSDVTILDVLRNAEHNISVADWSRKIPDAANRRTTQIALLYAIGQVHNARALLERGYPPNTVIEEAMFAEFDEGETPPKSDDEQIRIHLGARSGEEENG